MKKDILNIFAMILALINSTGPANASEFQYEVVRRHQRAIEDLHSFQPNGRHAEQRFHDISAADRKILNELLRGFLSVLGLDELESNVPALRTVAILNVSDQIKLVSVEQMPGPSREAALEFKTLLRAYLLTRARLSSEFSNSFAYERALIALNERTQASLSDQIVDSDSRVDRNRGTRVYIDSLRYSFKTYLRETNDLLSTPIECESLLVDLSVPK